MRICLIHRWEEGEADNTKFCVKCGRKEYYSPDTNFKWVRY